MAKTKKMKGFKYPATVAVHWTTGPINACNEHAQQLVALGVLTGYLAAHVLVTRLESPSECGICVSEHGNDTNE